MTAETITVRYFAAARAAAACPQEDLALAELPATAPLDRDALVRVLAERHPTPPAGEPALADVLAQSSLLVGGVAMRPGHTVGAGDTVDVLPPFSGG